MKSKLKLFSILFLIPALTALSKFAGAAVVINNATLTLAVTTSAAGEFPVNLGAADVASWQYGLTGSDCQAKLQESNDSINWVDFNTAGSSITLPAASTTTVNNEMFSLQPILYRYVNWSVTNSSAPATGTAPVCNFSAVQCLKSITIQSN